PLSPAATALLRSGLLPPAQGQERAARQQQRQGREPETRKRRDHGRGSHLEAGRIVDGRRSRIIGELRRLVGAVAVGVEADGALVADGLAGGAVRDGGGDGDRHLAAGRNDAVPVRGVAARGGGAAGRRGAGQGELGRQHVGELVARVVLLVEGAGV